MRILTVLRSGGDFRIEHVERLRDQCAEYAPDTPFWCLTDDDRWTGNWIRLEHDWPGWWAKMEMFRQPGPCLYMDLDTTITGSLEPLLAIAQGCDSLMVLRDFNHPQRDVQSSLMAWSGDQSALYQAFAAAPARHMAENKTPRWWGDQAFIERNSKPEFWQDILPGAAVSWKKHCKAGIPDTARVVIFHGKPRPWEAGL